MKRLTAALLAGVMMFTTLVAEAAKPTDAMMANMIITAAAITGIPTPEKYGANPTRVLVVQDDQFLEEIGARAAYALGHRTLILGEDWNPDVIADCAALLHETVHYLQEMNGLDYEHYGGRGGLEKVAWDATIDYTMKAAATDREQALKILGTDEFTYLMATTNFGPEY